MNAPQAAKSFVFQILDFDRITVNLFGAQAFDWICQCRF